MPWTGMRVAEEAERPHTRELHLPRLRARYVSGFVSRL